MNSNDRKSEVPTRLRTMISDPAWTARWRGVSLAASWTLELTLALTLMRNRTLSMSEFCTATWRKLRPLLSTWTKNKLEIRRERHMLGFHDRFAQNFSNITQMLLKTHLRNNCISTEKCYATKKMFSPLAFFIPRGIETDGSFPLQHRHMLPSHCHCFCRGFFSPLHTSVWQFSIISTVIFPTASGRPSLSFLLRGLKLQLHFYARLNAITPWFCKISCHT